MSLQQWQENAWLIPHKPTPEDITSLWSLAQRDLRDASVSSLSVDWRFNIAYNATLQLCTLLLHAEGYAPARGQLAHYRVLQSLPLVLTHRAMDAEYLDDCRNLRNQLEYNRAGTVSERDTKELIAYACNLRESVLLWMKEKHPDLLNSS